MNDINVLILGLGLIGGSLAKALHDKALFNNITAVDTDAESLEHAFQEGVISKGFQCIDEACAAESDLIFICTPCDCAIEYIKKLHGKIKPGCIITDTCSIKGTITDFSKALTPPVRFIGGHPMAGSEKVGYKNSKSHLFENACYVLTPTNGASENDVVFLKKIIKQIGAIPVVMDSEEHDLAAAGISHLPHVIAAALVNMIKQKDSTGNMKLLAAGGFRDITRIASSNPQMWRNIISGNRNHVLKLIDSYINILNNVRTTIDNSNDDMITVFFEQARDFRNAFDTNIRGFIEPQHEIMLDVVDKPGIIGNIATILGQEGINIKNISISNSREFENGCLKITLPDKKSLEKASRLLTDKGYRLHKS